MLPREPAARRRAPQVGVRLDRYVPHHTFALALDAPALQRALALADEPASGVLWVGAMADEHKMDARELAAADADPVHPGARPARPGACLTAVQAVCAFAAASVYVCDRVCVCLRPRLCAFATASMRSRRGRKRLRHTQTLPSLRIRVSQTRPPQPPPTHKSDFTLSPTRGVQARLRWTPGARAPAVVARLAARADSAALLAEIAVVPNPSLPHPTRKRGVRARAARRA